MRLSPSAFHLLLESLEIFRFHALLGGTHTASDLHRAVSTVKDNCKQTSGAFRHVALEPRATLFVRFYLIHTAKSLVAHRSTPLSSSSSRSRPLSSIPHSGHMNPAASSSVRKVVYTSQCPQFSHLIQALGGNLTPRWWLAWVAYQHPIQVLVGVEAFGTELGVACSTTKCFLLRNALTAISTYDHFNTSHLIVCDYSSSSTAPAGIPSQGSSVLDCWVFVAGSTVGIQASKALCRGHIPTNNKGNHKNHRGGNTMNNVPETMMNMIAHRYPAKMAQPLPCCLLMYPPVW